MAWASKYNITPIEYIISLVISCRGVVHFKHIQLLIDNEWKTKDITLLE